MGDLMGDLMGDSKGDVDELDSGVPGGGGGVNSIDEDDEDEDEAVDLNLLFRSTTNISPVFLSIATSSG